MHIVMVEDDPDDRLLLQEAFEENSFHHTLFFLKDGETLLDYLYHRGKYQDTESFPFPDLIILDLNMPRKDGREVLAEIKSDPRLRTIPVIIFTTSRIDEDIIYTYQTGACSYITKPDSFEDLRDLALILGRYWFETVNTPSRVNGG